MRLHPEKNQSRTDWRCGSKDKVPAFASRKARVQTLVSHTHTHTHTHTQREKKVGYRQNKVCIL
jgi:hypothetical protein